MADVTILYQISTKRVWNISRRRPNRPPQDFPSIDANYWAKLEDPTWNGSGDEPQHTVMDDATGKLSTNLNEAFVVDDVGNTFREATQLEIDAFAATEEDDESQMDVDAAVRDFRVNPRQRKKWIALLRVIRDTNVQMENVMGVIADPANTLADIRAAASQVDLVTTRAELQALLDSHLSKDD